MSSREYPKVWKRFERELEGRFRNFQIEDIPESMWSTAVEFMLGHYIREDVWWVTAGTADDPDSVQEYRLLLSSMIKMKMSLACFLVDNDGSDKTLIGVNICLPQKRDQFVEHNPPKTKAGIMSLQMFSKAMEIADDVYARYNTDSYLMGAGISVAPEYRRLGLATELLKARAMLSGELGFIITCGIFTSESAQKAAEKANMKCVCQISYEDFGIKCNIKFLNAPNSLKIYAIRSS